MDKLVIQDLRVLAQHGLFEEDKKEMQEFFVSLELDVKRKMDAKTVVNYTVHHGRICRHTESYIQEHGQEFVEDIAEGLAESILVTFPFVDHVKMVIRSTGKEVGMPFANIGVKLERGWHTAYICMGSNKGKRIPYLESALDKIKMRQDCHVTNESLLLETEAYGDPTQNDFVNGCIELKTLLEPHELLAYLNELKEEAKAGVEVATKQKVLGLHILYYDDLILSSRELVLPFEDMENRRYILDTLMDVAPFKRHPILGSTTQELLSALPEEEE